MSRYRANLEVCDAALPQGGGALAKGPSPFASDDTVPYGDDEELATLKERPKRRKRSRSYSNFDPTATKAPRKTGPRATKKPKKKPETGPSSTSNAPSTEEEDVCCICLDVPKVRGKINSCDHRYCYCCIKRWSEETNTCPQCKKRFTKLERVPAADDASAPKGKKPKRKKKDVITIKKKDIQSSSDHQLSGILARVFEHFALRPVSAVDHPRSRNNPRSGLHRLFRLERRVTPNAPPTSIDDPISLLDSDDESAGSNGESPTSTSTSSAPAIRSEVDMGMSGASSSLNDLVTDLPTLIRRIGAVRGERFRMSQVSGIAQIPTSIQDGRGTSAETAIALLSDDEEDDEEAQTGLGFDDDTDDSDSDFMTEDDDFDLSDDDSNFLTEDEDLLDLVFD
jgi:hypothetical protein